MSQTLQAMVQALESPGRTLRRSRMRNAARAGVQRAAGAALVAALLSVAGCAALALASVPISPFVPLALTLGVVLLAALEPILRAGRRTAGIQHVAERVDAALRNHNALSTALDLEMRGDRSLFAQLAIEQGRAQLARVDATTVLTEPAAPIGARPFLALAGGVTLLAVAFVIRPALSVEAGERALAPGVALALQTDREARPEPSDPETPEPDSPRGDGRAAVQSQASPVAAVAVPGDSSAASASADAAQMGAASQAAGSRGASSASPGGPAAPSTEPEAESGQPDAPAADVGTHRREGVSPSGQAGTDGQARGAASTPGVSGTDSTDEKSVASGANMTSDEQGTNDEAAEVDKQEETAYQTAGQPLRQDRSPPGSRELGQSGTSGESGSGRGGPGETKKTRGVGAVFLSVPVPDHLSGKMAPGLSQITRRWIPPQPQSSAPPAPAPVRGNGTENVIRRFDIPWADVHDVARFLEAVHRDEAAPVPNSEGEERP